LHKYKTSSLQTKTNNRILNFQKEESKKMTIFVTSNQRRQK